MEQLRMIAVSKARASLSDLADDPQPTLLLRHSDPKAVLVPYATWVELHREIEDLKGTLAAYRSQSNSSPDLRLSTEKVLAELGFDDDE